MITASAISAFQSIETPFYYYDMELLDKTLDIYTQQIKKYGYHAHFALKANANARILEKIKNAYIRYLTTKLDREVAAGSTLWGIHKDDVEILLNGKSARMFAFIYCRFLKRRHFGI